MRFSADQGREVDVLSCVQKFVPLPLFLLSPDVTTQSVFQFNSDCFLTSRKLFRFKEKSLWS